jgi:hypothetical protein
VNGGRHELLSGARFAGDQDPRLGGSHSGNQRSHLLHGRAAADQAGPAAELRLERAVLRSGSIELERRSDRDQHGFGAEGLLQELEGPQLHRPHCIRELGLAAHHDDWRRVTTLAHQREGLQAIRPRRHQQIEQDDIRIGFLQQQQGRVAVGSLGDGESLAVKQGPQHAPDVCLVVHQQHLRAVVHWAAIRTTNVAPPPGVSIRSIEPPCISMVCLTSASPKPVPPGFPVQ